MKIHIKLALTVCFVSHLSAVFAEDPLRLNGLFKDNMVLQRDREVSVYGSATPSSDVTVAFNGQIKRTQAEQSGNWQLKLSPMKKSFEPEELVVKSDKSEEPVVISNVLVGDVWLCSGQSNMERWFETYPLLKSQAAEINNPDIRSIVMARRSFAEPDEEIVPKEPFADAWHPASQPWVSPLSPTAYYFAAKLRRDLDVPVGLIVSAVGGTQIQRWIPRAIVEGLHLDSESSDGAGVLYNSMIHPLRKFTIKGVVWYQGESNGRIPHSYHDLTQAHIKTWRDVWARNNPHLNEMPFFTVQIAPFQTRVDGLTPDAWAYIRDAQLKTLSLPNTGLVVTTDLGEYADIHPQDKQPVGERLALWAEKFDGRAVTPSGPLYEKAVIDGDIMNVYFSHGGSGLETRHVAMSSQKNVWAKDDPDAYVVPADKLAGFIVCGADRKFVPAEAVIVDDHVQVSSKDVSDPVAVRYGWSTFPLCNLYNKEGLPASPFRSDSFPVPDVQNRTIGKEYKGNDTEMGHQLQFTGSTSETAWEKVTKAGKQGYQPAKGQGSKPNYAYFKVTDTSLKSGKSPQAVVSIVYFDQGDGTVLIQYDSTDKTVRVVKEAPGAWKQGGKLKLENTGTWKKVEFTIDDAFFDARCNGADIRLNCPESFIFSKLYGRSDEQRVNSEVGSPGITTDAEVLQSRAMPGTPRVNKTMYETQDWVITTHNALDYGVTPDDERDDTSAFQKAIDACYADGGGVVFVPAGKYIFKEKLHLQSGVILRGEWRNPEKNSSSPIGTLFCVYYGRNQADAAPFILMSSSTGLKDLAIWYPEQSFTKPLPYATTVKQDGGLCASLENVTIYNAWKGIVLGPEANQYLTVKNLFMTALHIGFVRDQAYDCPRLHKVYMSPKYWIESGLPASPVTEADQTALKKFLLRESIGAMITHYDWVWMYDWHIEGFHTGIVTCPSLVKTDKPGPNGGWVKLRLKDNYIGMQLGNNNHQGWSSTDVLITSRVPNSIGIKAAADFGSISQFSNITFEGRFKYCILTRGKKGRITFSGCNFKSWANDGYAVYAEAGTIELIKSRFLQPDRHIQLGESLVSAGLLGNTFSGSPDIRNDAPESADIVIDHKMLDIKLCDISEFEFPEAIYKPENQALYNVRDFGAKGDSVNDDSRAFQKALNTAADKGGGTVYVPAGKYVLNTGLVVPEKIELRGVSDMTHHTSDSYVKRGIEGSELFARVGKGDEKETPLIRLKSGASLRGVTVYYPEQKWSDYVTNGKFTEFPWTIQSLGTNVRVKDVVLANSYKGADFGTYDSTGHRIDFLCGTVLKTGLYVDKCFGKGYIKSTHWNPSFWTWSQYPDRQENCDTLRDHLIDTLTAYIFGYTQEEHTLHMFSFGSKTGTKFINNPEYGGANGIFIGNGTDLSETSLRFEDIGTNARFINFQIVSMGSKNRKRYLDIGENVKGKAEFYNLLMWGYDPGVDCGIEMKSGDFYFLQMNFRTHGQEYGIKQTGGKLTAIAPSFHLAPGDWLTKKPDIAGRYAYWGSDIIKADLIGTLIKNKHTDQQLFLNRAGDKCSISHSIHY